MIHPTYVNAGPADSSTPTGSPVRGRAARGHGSSLHLLARPTTLVLADLGHGDPAWLHPCSPVAHQSSTVLSGAERKQPFSTCLIRKYISYTLNSKHRIFAMKIGQLNAFDRNFVVYSCRLYRCASTPTAYNFWRGMERRYFSKNIGWLVRIPKGGRKTFWFSSLQKNISTVRSIQTTVFLYIQIFTMQINCN